MRQHLISTRVGRGAPAPSLSLAAPVSDLRLLVPGSRLFCPRLRCALCSVVSVKCAITPYAETGVAAETDATVRRERVTRI